MSNNVHVIAQTGFGEGTNELYDRARPSYPSESLEFIRSLNPSDSLNILELGAGTGIFTRALLAHPAWTGNAIASLRAVEPSAGMRTVFARTVIVPELDPGQRVSVHDGTFDGTGAPDGWADLVIIAQAFHWCPDHEAACTELRRVLKPGGALCLIWNLEDRDGAQWVARLRDTYEVHEAGTPQYHRGLWRPFSTVSAYTEGFAGPPEEYNWKRVLPATADIVSERVFSKSYITVLSEEEKARLARDVQRIVVDEGEQGGKRWMDKEKGVFEYPYNTHLVVARTKA
ncbi:S-adenosyl-L-methionine-dependent methyltransferase [Coniophora puteana RWD-64-598 SS2]|uniref:S-adenosyl-L-methionine-dependent methyltransferase n=1 Tax=Coniophora puteana (strain RWD-64-598) TaxID=741705 RepID=A0A5M3M9Z3_CONPW|nr:S-adenosyl-L-methionine-dependent methyltransferase [Coniophora puteana RWD-64-598 SS2]EIW75943.1 S-adenosyl-L-methionine-dependent methyltransferase [Coniophora puteana RWD-64-598 SS2]